MNSQIKILNGIKKIVSFTIFETIMKPLNTYLPKLSFVFLLFLALQSCKPHEPGTWKNDQIDAGQRKDFHALAEQAFIPLKANDIKAAKLLMSKDMIDDGVNTEKMVEHVSNRLADNKYSLMDEYYVVAKNSKDTITIDNAGAGAYKLKLPPLAREMYIAFYIPKNAANQYMITMLYAKYSYGWKLSTLDVEAFTVGGKTGPELFELAKKEFDKKYLVSAVINMTSAYACMRPSVIWKYKDEDAVNNFYNQVVNAANTTLLFPHTFTSLPMRPQLQSITNEDTDEGSFPLIRYMTHVELADTNAVKKERVQVTKELIKLFPGLDKDTKYIYYEAFNKFPRSNESVDRFKMVDKY